MNKRRLLIRLVPIGIAAVVVFFQFFSSEKVTNEAGRTARHALDPKQEEALGLPELPAGPAGIGHRRVRRGI